MRTAEQPGQTLNVDLCFVPVQHEPQVKQPAVSGSSGRLVVERPMKEGEEPSWPGQVFANLELDYQAAMQAYVAATRDRLSLTRSEKVVKGGRKSEKQALWRADQALREERFQVRERRKAERSDLESHPQAVYLGERCLSSSSQSGTPPTASS